MVQTEDQQAHVLNEFFSSVIFIEEELNQTSTLENQYQNDLVENCRNGSQKAKTTKRNRKSADSGGIHPCILKETAEAICSPLALIL